MATVLRQTALKRESRDVWSHSAVSRLPPLWRPLQVERDNLSLISRLQESQTQLQHTQGALDEQHDRALRLGQKVTALRRLRRGDQLARGAASSSDSDSQQLHGEQQEQEEEEEEKEGLDDDEGDREGGERRGSRCHVFAYQTPGLEILQCKNRVAVTEVVELKAELQMMRERSTAAATVGEEKAREGPSVREMEEQVARLEMSCREGRDKVIHQRAGPL